MPADAWHRSDQSAHIERIHRDVGLIAGVDRGGQFAGHLRIERKTGGEKNQALASGDGREIFRQIANRQQKSVSAKGSFRVLERVGHAQSIQFVGVNIARVRVAGNIWAVDAGDGFRQAVGVGGEILHDLQAAAKIHHGHYLIRAGMGFDEFRRGAAGPGLIAQVHRSGIEKQDEIMALAFHWGVGIGAEGETVDRLLLVVLIHFEIFLGQVGDVIAFFVGDHHIHANFIRFRFDRVGIVGRRRLLRRGSRGWGRRLLLRGRGRI